MSFREILNKSREEFCTGCGACASICTTGALHIIQDDFGYYMSNFDSSKCIHCNQCDDVCPILHPKSMEKKYNEPVVYAVQMKDNFRTQGSSGGVFPAVATAILNTNKAVVFGAAWQGDNLIHIGVDSASDLHEICGSKYVQSYTKNSYQKVKDELLDDRIVLYCGCPCQIAGLYSFLEKEYKNLYTIDLLCYYAPSIQMFQNYLKEMYGGVAKAWNFRDKKLGWSCENLSITLEVSQTNNDPETRNSVGVAKKIVKSRNEDIFEQSYHSHLLMSKHCENCKFNKIPRQGDITLGDFWGIKNFDETFNDNKGTSIVIVNSKKGNELLELSRQYILKIRKSNIKYIKGNRIGREADAIRSEESKRFYSLYKRMGNLFCKSAELSLNHKYDVAIVGCWDIKNYGSQLTYYSLFKVIEKLGLSTIMIGCHKRAQYKSVGKPILFKDNPYSSFDLSKQYENKIEMLNVNDLTNTFIVGPDQVWNSRLYKHFGEFTLLDFIFSDKNKISYAASFGNREWSGDEIDKVLFKFCLNRFNKISVRETSGIDICKKTFSINADWAIDPVFLAGKNVFSELTQNITMNVPNKYVFAYLLDYSNDKVELLNEISERLSCECIVVTDPNQSVANQWKKYAHTEYYIEEWLWLFQHAQYVLTDSFHGMCVSLIYKKNFTAIVNKNRGSARFEDYSSILGLNDYIINSARQALTNGFVLSNVDYERINPIIEKCVQLGLEWLTDSILNYTADSLTSYDESLVYRYKAYQNKLQNRVKYCKLNRYTTKQYGFISMCRMVIKSIKYRFF